MRGIWTFGHWILDIGHWTFGHWTSSLHLDMRYFYFFVVIAFFSCGAPVIPESRVDKLAKGLCGCTEQLLALNKQAESASDSLAFRNIATEFAKVRACTSNLGILPEDRAALELALATKCPGLAAHPDFLAELLGF